MYMRVDVGFPGHEKAIKAGGDAVWMWLAMKVYAKVQATDGRVPGCMIGRLQGPDPARQKRLVKRLVEAGLVDVEGSDYRLHDYLDWEESSEQAAVRQAAARRRKADWERRHKEEKEHRTSGDGNGVTGPPGNAVTNAVTNGVGPDVTNRAGNRRRGVEGSGGELDPPTPFPEERAGGSQRPTPRDPLEHLAGSAPQQRPEVIQVFETFCAAVGQPNRRMRKPGFECLDANHIAEALATYGLEQCLLVANHAPNDGRVNGTTDERREKHDTVRYVFGNPDTFARILHAAQGAAAQPGRRNANRSMAEVMAEARAGGVR